MTGVTPLGLLALLDALTLLVTSALLLYPVVRYSTNVAHPRGTLALSAAFFLLTVAAVDAVLYGASLRLSAVVLLASLASLVGTAAFARPFLSLPARPGDTGADAGDDATEPAPFESQFGQEGDR
ncbi:hypothetical protein [Halolamina salifodinae]|uniref:Uncharacterized protein n=1 Tax=Halolamina salifodinae TaxID=1202767 RepID=A0A8T4GVG5_9EURY|nr:hypothetical protein [Halolamina salifodinae]MBP1985684.1 hypothetical protein [Halolamina salifodinae]